jgi:hypothetical protein
MAKIDGSDPIEVCALPTVPLFVEGEVLDNPKQVKADLKDDIGAYNAKMLVNMSDFFQKQVESKSAGAKKMISPDGESCTLASNPPDNSEEEDHVVRLLHPLCHSALHPHSHRWLICDTTP